MAGYASPQWNNNSAPAIDADALTALSNAAELSEHPFGTCTTAAASAAKTATIDFSGTLTLFAGLVVYIKFANSNTASEPTLSVNETEACPIVFAGSAVGNGAWIAGEIKAFVFDGTRWNIINRAVDTTPTENSKNLVTSGAVFAFNRKPTLLWSGTTYSSATLSDNPANYKFFVVCGQLLYSSAVQRELGVVMAANLPGVSYYLWGASNFNGFISYTVSGNTLTFTGLSAPSDFYSARVTKILGVN